MMETPHLTELEARLAQPDGALLQQAHLNQLDTLALQLRQRLQAGVSREEFTVLQAVDLAVQAAQQVLTNWPVPEITTTLIDTPRRTSWL